MFHYDDGLKLTSIDLAIDFRRRQRRGFISHAHADHMAPHELAFCTPATARLYRRRHGCRRTYEMPYGAPLDWCGLRLTAYPAGHVLGSAMLLVSDGEQTLLYTGDFKLGASATAGKAELPTADILVMESTYGDPRYCFPPREHVVEQLLDRVTSAVDAGVTPVIRAYVLGKAQETTKLITNAGVRVLQHPLVYEISRVYEECGCQLGDYGLYEREAAPGCAVIMPPLGQRAASIRLPERTTTIAVTGWAMGERAKHRLGVDHALPLSDHADHNQLLECAARVEPKVVYCTHGPTSFADQLRALGYDARVLGS
jgi:Cft2 family RNA processing exonuclease